MTPMKRASLEVQMRTLDPEKSASVKDHINKLKSMKWEILQTGKAFHSRTWESHCSVLCRQSMEVSTLH
eukprot:c3300_g1_i1 orf=632-838(+)